MSISKKPNKAQRKLADDWNKLNDKWANVQPFAGKYGGTPVPGGMVYQVRFKGRGVSEEWVFLNVAHSIGRCKLVPTALAARVF